MTTASRSLATALWRARFASGLLRPSYTTSWDTTGGGPIGTDHGTGRSARAFRARGGSNNYRLSRVSQSRQVTYLSYRAPGTAPPLATTRLHRRPGHDAHERRFPGSVHDSAPRRDAPSLKSRRFSTKNPWGVFPDFCTNGNLCKGSRALGRQSLKNSDLGRNRVVQIS